MCGYDLNPAKVGQVDNVIGNSSRFGEQQEHGRNLSGGANSTVIFNLIEPGTGYEKRLNQLDFRVARSFPFQGGRRIKATFDLYNTTNSNPVTVHSTTYGTTGERWVPLQILPGRLAKFEVQVTF